MFCAKCGKKNNDDASFCQYCGAGLKQKTIQEPSVVFCRACGKYTKGNADLCIHCGASGASLETVDPELFRRNQEYEEQMKLKKSGKTAKNSLGLGCPLAGMGCMSVLMALNPKSLSNVAGYGTYLYLFDRELKEREKQDKRKRGDDIE